MLLSCYSRNDHFCSNLKTFGMKWKKVFQRKKVSETVLPFRQQSSENKVFGNTDINQKQKLNTKSKMK